MMNPLQFMKAMRNPQEFMQNIMINNEITKNPIAKNAMEMYQKGDTKGLQSMAENLCKERGTTPQQVQEMIKKQFGM